VCRGFFETADVARRMDRLAAFANGWRRLSERSGFGESIVVQWFEVKVIALRRVPGAVRIPMHAFGGSSWELVSGWILLILAGAVGTMMVVVGMAEELFDILRSGIGGITKRRS